MGAHVRQTPLVQHHDAVAGHDGVDALGDDDLGGAGQGRPQTAADVLVGGHVHGGGGVVQDQDFWPLQDGPGDQQALALARRVSLPEELLDRYPTHISGGEQQRVAIARGLTMDRRLLLADEPTGNLDSENSDNIIDLLLKLAHDENRCVIVVTHDLSVMDRADVVYRINDGLLERR